MVRGVLQRVLSGSVKVNNQIVSKISQGVCVLVGLTHHDTKQELEYLCRKILNTRLWPNLQGKHWMTSVKDCQYEVLIISQFTLYHIHKGNKLDFHQAMETQKAHDSYQLLIDMLKTSYESDKIKNGAFGQYMNIELVNDGPVTLILSKEPPSKHEIKENKDKIKETEEIVIEQKEKEDDPKETE